MSYLTQYNKDLADWSSGQAITRLTSMQTASAGMTKRDGRLSFAAGSMRHPSAPRIHTIA
jgi:hypothetical protein